MELWKLGVRQRVRSAGYAVRGLWTVLNTQPNTWYMLAATGATIAAGVILRVSRAEWALLAVAIAVVWIAEVFNSAIEFLTDLVSPNYHPLAGKAKDASAAAALLAVLLSLVIALVVFGPRLAGFLR